VREWLRLTLYSQLGRVSVNARMSKDYFTLACIAQLNDVMKAAYNFL